MLASRIVLAAIVVVLVMASGVQVVAPDGTTPLGGISAVAAGGSQAFALNNDGTLLGWGNNMDGQVGDGRGVTHRFVKQVVGVSGETTLRSVIAAAAGANHALALVRPEGLPPVAAPPPPAAAPATDSGERRGLDAPGPTQIPVEWAHLGPHGPLPIQWIGVDPNWPDSRWIMALRGYDTSSYFKPTISTQLVRTRDGAVSWDLLQAPDKQLLSISLAPGVNGVPVTLAVAAGALYPIYSWTIPLRHGAGRRIRRSLEVRAGPAASGLPDRTRASGADSIPVGFGRCL